MSPPYLTYCYFFTDGQIDRQTEELYRNIALFLEVCISINSLSRISDYVPINNPLSAVRFFCSETRNNGDPSI